MANTPRVPELVPERVQLHMGRPLGPSAGEPPVPPLPAGFQLVRATEAQAPLLASVLAENGELGEWDEGRARGLFDDEAEPQVGQLILVLNEGRAVATAQLDLHQHDRYAGLAEVGWVAVVPHMQGRRLGSVVTQAVIGEAEERGRREVFLRTDDWRLPAVVSYLRLGFRPWLIEPTALERWQLVFGQLNLPVSAMGERALQRPWEPGRAGHNGETTGDAGVAGDVRHDQGRGNG